MADDERGTGNRGTESRGTPASKPTTPAGIDPGSREDSRSLIQKVMDFAYEVGVSDLYPKEQLTYWGQFFWGHRLHIGITERLDALLDADPKSSKFVKGAKKVLNNLNTINVANLEKLARKQEVEESTRKVMLSFVPAKPTANPQILQKELWDKLNASKLDKLPVIPQEHLNLRTALANAEFEPIGCHFTATQMAKRFFRRRRKPSINGVAQSFVGTAPYATSDRAPDKADNRVLGERVTQHDLAKTVPRMLRALDGGHLILARVLSGVGYGLGGPLPKDVKVDAKGRVTTFPKEEHFLVVFAHNGSDMFVFYDPDAASSRYVLQGFGVLYYDAAGKMLNTASEPDAMRVGSVDEAEGRHIRKGKPHNRRYQVLSVTTAFPTD
jgi:hypothetical protein